MEWVIKSVKSPVTMEIYNGKLTKVLHINCLQHRCVPDQQDIAVSDDFNSHCPERFLPSVDHIILPQHLNELCQITALNGKEDHRIGTGLELAVKL